MASLGKPNYLKGWGYYQGKLRSLSSVAQMYFNLSEVGQELDFPRSLLDLRSFSEGGGEVGQK